MHQENLRNSESGIRWNWQLGVFGRFGVLGNSEYLVDLVIWCIGQFGVFGRFVNLVYLRIREFGRPEEIAISIQ